MEMMRPYMTLPEAMAAAICSRVGRRPVGRRRVGRRRGRRGRRGGLGLLPDGLGLGVVLGLHCVLVLGGWVVCTKKKTDGSVRVERAHSAFAQSTSPCVRAPHAPHNTHAAQPRHTTMPHPLDALAHLQRAADNAGAALRSAVDDVRAAVDGALRAVGAPGPARSPMAVRVWQE